MTGIWLLTVARRQLEQALDGKAHLQAELGSRLEEIELLHKERRAVLEDVELLREQRLPPLPFNPKEIKALTSTPPVTFRRKM